MRQAIVAALMLTGACAPTAAEERVPEHGVSPGYRCDAAPAQSLDGRQATSELGAEALKRTGARTIRWIQPGQAVTMDYREDRLNIALDAHNRVTRVSCG